MRIMTGIGTPRSHKSIAGIVTSSVMLIATDEIVNARNGSRRNVYYDGIVILMLLYL